MIPITKPYTFPEEEKLVTRVLRSGWLTQGEQTAEFEKMVAKYVGAKYAVACNSCTTALFLCLKVLGIEAGDEVIVPSYTFIATPNAVMQTGARPVFAEINLATYNIDPEDIEKRITKRTKAVIAVDQVGLPADWSELNRIGKKYGLKIVSDAACALGSTYHGRRVGGLAELNCFSFHPRKLITTGEGGMITTDNQRLARELQTMVSHGASLSEISRHKARHPVKETYNRIGYNFRLSNVQGAMGVSQMKKLDWILKQRVRLAERYNRAFSRSVNIIAPVPAAGVEPNYQTYMVRLSPAIKISREKIIARLAAAGIASRPGIMACHLEPVYRKIYPKINLPNTESASATR